MAGRMIAIGDIHGCSKALAALLDAIVPTHEDTLVALGDFIDRGPDSRDVLEKLIALKGQCSLIPLLGNHEEKLLDALHSKEHLRRWLASGGIDTLRSYGWKPEGGRRAVADWIPKAHRAFISSCLPYHETASHVFLHAGYVPALPLEEQPSLALRWRVTDARNAIPHCSGKVAVVGHTPQLSGEVLDLGFLVCIDTNCVRGGWLTAFETNTGQVWQANNEGKMRIASKETF